MDNVQPHHPERSITAPLPVAIQRHSLTCISSLGKRSARGETGNPLSILPYFMWLCLCDATFPARFASHFLFLLLRFYFKIFPNLSELQEKGLEMLHHKALATCHRNEFKKVHNFAASVFVAAEVFAFASRNFIPFYLR